MAVCRVLSLVLISSLLLSKTCHAAHFVLVHGASQSAWAWFPVIPLLEAAGHNVTAVQLLGSGTDCTPPADLPTVQAIAQPLLDVLTNSSQPVILVGHSLGGVFISTAAEALPEKVSKLIYIAALMLPNNQTVLESISGYPTILSDNLVFLPEGGPPVYGGIKPEAIIPATFNRCTRDLQVLGVSLTKPQLLAPISQPVLVSPERWGSIKRYYVRTDQDNAVSPELQKALIAKVGVDKAFFLPGSDHMPQFSTTWKLVQILHKILTL